jgi:glycosyltransferase involved in cell wall biosynthesis
VNTEPDVPKDAPARGPSGSEASPTDRPAVSVLIPIYNGVPTLDATVRSVLSQDFPSLELLLIDDGSRDGSAHAVERWARSSGRVRAIFHAANRGIARTLNRGIAEARGEFLLILHQDCRLIGHDWVSRAVEELSASDAVGLVAQPYLAIEGMSPTEKWSWIIRSHLYPTSADSGAASETPLFSENKCDLFRTAALRDVGGFDEYFRAGGEDQALAVALESRHLKLLFSSRARFELSSGDGGSLGLFLKREFKYGREIKSVLRRTRLAAVRRTSESRWDPRLVNRVVAVAWICLTLASVVLAIAFRQPTILAVALAAALGRALMLGLRAARNGRRYRLRVRDLWAVGGIGLLADVCYFLGFLTPSGSSRSSPPGPGYTVG